MAEPAPIAHVLHQLLVLRRDLREVETEFSWFQLDDEARAFLDGPQAYTERQWQHLDDHLRQHDYLQQLHPVLVAAHAHPRLGVLYPFTSLDSLQFSRCTGYPFDCHCPGICLPRHPQPDDYQTHYWGKTENSNQTKFKGHLEDAIQFIAAQLPSDCGPARQGTADDM